MASPRDRALAWRNTRDAILPTLSFKLSERQQACLDAMYAAVVDSFYKGHPEELERDRGILELPASKNYPDMRGPRTERTTVLAIGAAIALLMGQDVTIVHPSKRMARLLESTAEAMVDRVKPVL